MENTTKQEGEKIVTEIVTSFDQPTGDSPLPIIQKVNDAFGIAIQTDDPEPLFDIIKQLRFISQASGIALAKSLYLLDKHWGGKETKEKLVELIGISPTTYERYIRVWMLFEENYIPSNLQEEMMGFNIKHLIPIGNAVNQGYKFEDADWYEIVTEPNGNAILKKVREVKGQPPRKGTLQIFMDEYMGDLYTWDEDGEKVYVGYLSIDSDEEVAKKAINRIIEKSGVIKSD